MKSKLTTLLILTCLMISILPLKSVNASVTYSPTDTYDDLYRTESGNVFFNTPYIPLADDDVSLSVFLRYENIAIANYIKSAILRFKVNNDYEAGSGITITIRGLDENDCAEFGSIGSWNLDRPVTSEYKNVDISSWNTSGTYDVDVKSIVKEIVYRYGWSTGNALGFKILCAPSGGPIRQVVDTSFGTGNPVKLIIDTGTIPSHPINPDYPDDDYEWVPWEDNNRGLDVWNVTQITNATIEYLFNPSVDDDLLYHNWTYTGHIIDDEIDTGVNGFGVPGRFMGRTNGVVFFQISDDLYWSNDYGNNWNQTPLENLVGLDAYEMSSGSLQVDLLNSTIVHAMVNSKCPEEPTYAVAVYFNFTIDRNGPDNFSTYERVGISAGSYGNTDVNLYVDEYGRQYAVYSKNAGGSYRDVVFRTKLLSETSWSSETKISDSAIGNHYSGAFVFSKPKNSTYYESILSFNANYPPEDQVEAKRWNGTDWGSVIHIDSTDGNFHDAVFNPWSNITMYVWKDFDSNRFVSGKYYNFTDNSWSSRFDVSLTNQDEQYCTVAYDNKTSIYHFFWYSQNNMNTKHRAYIIGVGFGSIDISCNEDSQTGITSVPISYGVLGNTTFLIYDNNTLIDETNDIDEIDIIIDEYLGTDPEDPYPPGENWEGEPWTRLQFKLYLLIFGLGCLFGPPIYFAYERPDIRALLGGLMFMLVGLGLLMSLTQI